MFDFLRNFTKSAEEKRQEALSAYLSDALPPKERQQFEAQLAQDAALQAELEQLRALRQVMRQMPQRRVPRNFTLDPAVYGRPARQPLIQAYPILRGATALTAVFLIFTLAAGLFTGLGSGAQSVAVEEAAPAAEVALEAPAAVPESVEITRVVTEEVAEAEAADSTMEEMEIPVEEAAPAPDQAAEEAPAGAASAAPPGEIAATKGAAPEVEAEPAGEEGLALPQPTMTPQPTRTAVPVAQATVPAASSRQSGDSEIAGGQPEVSVEPTAFAFNGEEIGGEEAPAARGITLTPLQWLQLGLLLLLLVLAAVTLYVRRQVG